MIFRSRQDQCPPWKLAASGRRSVRDLERQKLAFQVMPHRSSGYHWSLVSAEE